MLIVTFFVGFPFFATLRFREAKWRHRFSFCCFESGRFRLVLAVQHGTNCKTSQARRKLLSEARNPVRQMLRLALKVASHRIGSTSPFRSKPKHRSFVPTCRKSGGAREHDPPLCHRLNCFSSYLND